MGTRYASGCIKVSHSQLTDLIRKDRAGRGGVGTVYVSIGETFNWTAGFSEKTIKQIKNLVIIINYLALKYIQSTTIKQHNASDIMPSGNTGNAI